VRIAVKRPRQDPEIRDVADDRGAIAALIGARTIDTRPFTLNPPHLAITFDEDFVRHALEPNVQHPYVANLELCGTVVVTGYDPTSQEWRALRPHEEALALDLMRACAVENVRPIDAALHPVSHASHAHYYYKKKPPTTTGDKTE
jgi:hypothetical protein